MEKNKKILFLYYGPHPSHKGIAEIIGAVDSDILSYRKNNFEKILSYLKLSLNSSSYDVLLCEGTFLIPALFKLLPFKIFKKKIINISADPNLFYIKTRRINPFKRFLMVKALKNSDLFICVGEMESLILREILPNSKYLIVYPFIEEERYRNLLNIPYKQEFNHNILFIGNGPDWYCKGLDLLVETFKRVKEIYKDSNLYILGNWDEKIERNLSYDGVHFVGFDNVYNHILNSSLYLHLGRGEVFGISVLEAMLGGIPAIVSELTGSKEVVYNLRKDFVVPLNPLKAAEKVIEYFELSKEEKISLSIRAKELGKRFKKDIVLSDFINKWNSMMRCYE